MNPTKCASKPRPRDDAIRNITMILKLRTWDFTVIKHILKLNSSFINEPEFFGNTLLQQMVIDDRGTVEMVSFLIDHGAEVNLAQYDGNLLLSALNFTKNNKEIVRMLIERGADIKDERCGRSALSEAVANGYGTDILAMITSRGVDTNHINIYSQSVLCVALARGRELEIINFLMKAGATIGACEGHLSPLHCIASGSPIRSDVVRFLIRNGAGGNVVVDDLETTVIHTALRNAEYETQAMKMMLGLDDVDVNSLDSRHSTMLHEALWNHHCKIGVVQRLLDLGAEVECFDSEGDTPLHKAVLLCHGQPSFIRALLKSGSPVNFTNNHRETSFHIAVRRRQSLEIVRYLLGSGERPWHPETDALLNTVRNFSADRSRENLDRLQTLLKYALLENPVLDVMELVSDDSHFCGDPDAWMRFWLMCLREIELMARIRVWNRLTLLDVAGYHRQDIHLNNYDMFVEGVYKCSLRVLATGAFPMYSEVISAKIGYEFLQNVFSEMTMSITKFTVPLSVELSLNNHCMEHLGKFLSHNDLVNMILVFHREYRQQ